MPQPEPTLVTETDPEIITVLRHVIGQLEGLAPRFDTVQAIRAKPNSVEAADNAASNPLQVGQFVNYCLMAATDCTRAVTTLVMEGDTIMLPVVALHPVLRSAIEHASMAIWVDSAGSRRGRILRRLQAAHAELTHEKGLIASAVTGAPRAKEQQALRENAASEKKHNAYMRAIAEANGINRVEYENRLPGWEDIVRVAGAVNGMENDRLVTMWRFASGLSHPSFRRGTLSLEFLQQAEDGNILSGVMSAKSAWIAAEMGVTHRIVHAAVRGWGASKVLVNGERPVPSPVVPEFDNRGRLVRS